MDQTEVGVSPRSMTLPAGSGAERGEMQVRRRIPVWRYVDGYRMKAEF